LILLKSLFSAFVDDGASSNGALMSIRTVVVPALCALFSLSAAYAFPPAGDSGATTAPAPARHGSAPAPAAGVGKIGKAKAADAKTVAEVVSNKSALNGKPVTIRGKVVKAAHGILGKNWLHLQDGSGSPAAATHDIVVTSTESAEVGDIVNAAGVVRTEVDLGSGYRYAVLVEGAKLRK
jgi:hypothetical protein